MNKFPKVLVGCPTSDHKSYCLELYANCIKNLTYPNYDILIVDNSENEEYSKKIDSLGLNVKRIDFAEKARDRIIKARNLIRQEVLEKDYDYFLSLEQDVIPPKNIIELLLEAGEKVVAAVYPLVNKKNGMDVIRSSIWTNYDPDTKKMFRVKNDFVLNTQGLFEISASGLGSILIHRSVLEKIKFRYDPQTEGFDDVFFSKDVRDNGFKMYARLGFFCKHIHGGLSWDKIEK